MVSALISVWSRNTQSQRLSLPLLRTADLLFSQARLDHLSGPYIGMIVIPNGSDIF